MGIHDTRLLVAIQDRDVEAIEYEIRKLSNVNYQCQTRHTALHSAVLYNNVEAVRLLLERGANMMIIPFNKTYQNGHECPLLMAMMMGESCELLQLLFLRVLSETTALRSDPAALAVTAKLTQYAMMYTTPRVFFAAFEYDGVVKRVNPAGLTPLMCTLRGVGLYEKSAKKCARIMCNVLTIVDKCTEIGWERYNSKQTAECKNGYTALGLLMFDVIADRMQMDTHYTEALDAKEKAVALAIANGGYAMGTVGGVTPTGWFYPYNEAEIEMSRVHLQTITRNREVIAFFKKDFIPAMFGKMLSSMRTALGMATHVRLGNKVDCSVGQLDADVMNMIFTQVFNSIDNAESELVHMLC